MYVILTNTIFHPHNALINLDHWIVVDSFYCMAKRISNGDIQNLSLTWAIHFPHTFKTNPGFVILFSNMHLYYFWHWWFINWGQSGGPGSSCIFYQNSLLFFLFFLVRRFFSQIRYWGRWLKNVQACCKFWYIDSNMICF